MKHRILAPVLSLLCFGLAACDEEIVATADECANRRTQATCEADDLLVEDPETGAACRWVSPSGFEADGCAAANGQPECVLVTPSSDPCGSLTCGGGSVEANVYARTTRFEGQVQLVSAACGETLPSPWAACGPGSDAPGCACACDAAQ